MLSWTRRSRSQWTPALVLRVLLLMVLILVRAEPGAAANSTEASDISSFLSDTNLYGQDYRSFDVSGQLLCRNACLEEARCKAWTYVRPSIQGPTGKCWLKDRVPTEMADTCCISGVKKMLPRVARTESPKIQSAATTTFLTNTILYGQEYRSVDTRSPFLCRNACLEDDRCKAWTFARLGNRGAGTCSLKDGVPSKTAHTCCVSGVKAEGQVADTPENTVDPHILIAGLEVTFARDRGPDHRPIEPTKVFKDGDQAIFMIFRNTGSEPVRANVDIYTLNVEGYDTDARPWKPFSVLVQPSKRASYRVDAPETGLHPGTYRLAISAASSYLNAEIEVEPTEAKPTLASKEKKTAETKTVEKRAVDRGPHVQIGGLEVTFARRVSTDHRPTEPTRVFSENDRTIFLALRNGGARQVYTTINVFTIDVEGFDRNTRYWSNAWVNLPPGQHYTLSLDGPSDGLIPGTYRFEIKAGGSLRTEVIDVEPRYPYALREGEVEFGTNVNIALAALGGRVEQASQWGDGGWSKRHINDGLTWVRAPGETDNCIVCGWASREGDRRPEVVLSFHENREAEIAAVVVDTRRFWNRSKNYEHNTGPLPKNVAVLVSSVSATSGFERAATARLRRDTERQIIPLPDGTLGKFVKIEVLENFGAPAVVLAEVEVIESRSRERSILDDAEIDLANVALGGALVRYTGYDGLSAANLFDADESGTSWLSYDRYFPQDFTIAFKDDQEALVEKVRLTLSRTSDPTTWPSEIAIALSKQSPLDGFEEIGRFSVNKRSGSQEFPVGQKARFVKVRILDNHGGKRTSLSQISVIEGRRNGYASVLFRDGPAAEETLGVPQETESVYDDTVVEVEPNDNLASAGDLPLDRTLRGEIAPLGESDFFALPELDPGAKALTLSYSGRPYIRHGLSLLETGGGVISHFDPGDLPATDAKLTFALTGNERFLKLSEPAASVVVVWDTSGSMTGSEQDLERAVRDYVKHAPTNQRMNLIRFSDDVEALLSDFTSDKARLQAALRGKFAPRGGTRFYDAVLKGIELLQDAKGNKAMVVMTDGEDNGKTWHGEFWREVEKNRVRLFTIGLGHGLRNYSYAFGTTGERILQHLALGTNGDAFFATDSAALLQFYRGIADELSRPATYLLTPTVERGTGKLRLVATGEQVPSAAMPAVHLIYDLSGSMLERGPGGKPKYKLAQAAIYSALDALPDGAPFGFTVYGSRIPERAGKQKACTDIVTLQKLAPLDKQAVKNFVAEKKPKGGTTPLVGSVEHVVADFPQNKGGIIIVVTDGKEECNHDPAARITALKAGKMKHLDLELDVVGFALKDPKTRAMMETIAAVGGGQYFDAADGEALARALKEAMAAKYTVRDVTDQVVASGTIDGGDVSVPTGSYRVAIASAGSPIQVRDVSIEDDHLTTMQVNKVGSEVDVVASTPKLLVAVREARRSCGAQAARLDEGQRAARIQVKLNRLGFDVGPADNRPGAKTRRGIAAFANKYELPVDLSVDLLLEQHLDCVIAIGDTYLPAN